MLVTQNQRFNIPAGYLGILKFINQKYHRHFRKEDFKDDKAMIDYMLSLKCLLIHRKGHVLGVFLKGRNRMEWHLQ
jgi:hypothetical protein